MAPLALTASALVQQRLPDLLVNENTTVSRSTQRAFFNSTLGNWGRFEMNARKHFRQISWKNTVLDYMPDARDDTKNHVSHEQLMCGDEHSVVARFNQNVCHVMTSVMQSGGSDIRFGDFKTVVRVNDAETKVPDFAVIDQKAGLLLVGEAKTPWVHDIEDQLGQSMKNFRKYLDMLRLKCTLTFKSANTNSPTY